MGWRGTAVLGVALLGAAIYLYRDVTAEHPDASWRAVLDEPRPPPPGAQIKHLLAFDPATVTAIRLRRGSQQWEAQRTGDDWRGVARAGDVDDFLRALLDLAEIMPLEVGARDLADHGLDPPQSAVEITRRDAPPVVLLVGRRNPPSTAVYVQLGPGGPVVLTGALLLWELDKIARSFAAPA